MNKGLLEIETMDELDALLLTTADLIQGMQTAGIPLPPLNSEIIEKMAPWGFRHYLAGIADVSSIIATFDDEASTIGAIVVAAYAMHPIGQRKLRETFPQ